VTSLNKLQNRALQRAGFEVSTAVAMKSYVFWDATPCSTVEVDRRFKGTYRIYLQSRKVSQSKKPTLIFACFTLVSSLACSSTMKVGAICPSETWVDLHQATRRYIPEDRTLHAAKGLDLFFPLVLLKIFLLFASCCVNTTNNGIYFTSSNVNATNVY
jgi:hypothetical protein